MKCPRLNFSFFPAGGIETASSRIRVYTLAKALARCGVQSQMGFSLKANVLFFQKKLTAKSLLLARMAKASGRVTIYDVDDFGDALWYWVSRNHFRKMLRIADMVTVCSEMQMALLTSAFDIGKKGAVIPNAVDYCPTAPAKPSPCKRDKLQIVWFGNSPNFGLLEKYLNVLHKIPDSDITAIVDEWAIPDLSRKYAFVKFLPWRLRDFVSVLQSCDLACLMHDGTMYDQAKGNNRMISAITWGIPAVVSRTPEYERTAKESGIEYALFSSEADLPAVIERLRSPQSREQYLQTAQPAVWSRYAPDVIAQQYLDLVTRLISERQG